MKRYKVVELNGMKYIEMDEKGYPIVIDGNSEFGIDGIHLLEKIPDLQAEAKDHRVKKEEALKKLSEYEKKYDGIDPEEARSAIEFKKDIDLSKYVDKGQVDVIKAEITKVYEEKINKASEDYENTINALSGDLKSKEDKLKETLKSAYAKKNHRHPDSPDLFDIITFGLAASTLHKGWTHRSNCKDRVRRALKRGARAEAKAQCRRWF